MGCQYYKPLTSFILTAISILPPPETDTAKALAARIETAMAMLASWFPIAVSEAQLAAQIVIADAHAKDGFRLALLPGLDFDTARRCTAHSPTRRSRPGREKGRRSGDLLFRAAPAADGT